MCTSAWSLRQWRIMAINLVEISWDAWEYYWDRAKGLFEVSGAIYQPCLTSRAVPTTRLQAFQSVIAPGTRNTCESIFPGGWGFLHHLVFTS